MSHASFPSFPRTSSIDITLQFSMLGIRRRRALQYSPQRRPHRSVTKPFRLDRPCIVVFQGQVVVSCEVVIRETEIRDIMDGRCRSSLDWGRNILQSSDPRILGSEATLIRVAHSRQCRHGLHQCIIRLDILGSGRRSGSDPGSRQCSLLGEEAH